MEPTSQRPKKVRIDEGVAAAASRARRQKQPSQDVLNWGVPSNHEVTLHVGNQEGTDSWRYKALHFLHTSKMQMFFASLLLLDVLILFAELALLTIYPTCDLVERDAISCCPIITEEEAYGDVRLLAGDYNYCGDGLKAMTDFQAGCDSHKWHTVHTVEKFLISLTMAILGIFFVELTVTMIALKPKIFFRQVFYALDYFIVCVSLCLELLFVLRGDEISASLFGLVILGRIWRFVRIGHGIVELTEDVAHEREMHLSLYIEELEELLSQNNISLPENTLKPVAHSQHAKDDLLERLENHHREKKKQHYRKASSHTEEDSSP
mmetsp:Transcript_5200/g.10257  ORF Transcript_5200/g.10257 Transcript_5200/m.10257 type:complete len:322 (-) Transcript_5200:135-1100(-)|eukprot:scaffold10643_cov151-Amphora_coffeaeformis.AAC.5